MTLQYNHGYLGCLQVSIVKDRVGHVDGLDLTEVKRHRVMVGLEYLAGRNGYGRIVMHPSRRGGMRCIGMLLTTGRRGRGGGGKDQLQLKMT
jgi:hypothetical protein